MISTKSAFNEIGQDFRKRTATVVKMNSVFGDIDEHVGGSWMVDYVGDIRGTVEINNREELVDVSRRFSRFVRGRMKEYGKDDLEFRGKRATGSNWSGSGYYRYPLWFNSDDGFVAADIQMVISFGEDATCRIEEVEVVVPATTKKVRKVVCDD